MVPIGTYSLVSHCGVKWLISYLLLLLAALLVVAPASAQTGPLQTADDLVGGAVETTADTVGDLSQSDPVNVTGGLDGTVSTAQQTGSDLLGTATAPTGTSTPSTSGSATTEGTTTSDGSRTSSQKAGGAVSPGKKFRSRFDRLPLRLETLLERIELGRNVRANLARLQQALASLSAQDRARVLRLLNGEIRRLRTDGVSRVERKRIERLIRARERIAALGAPAPASTSAAGDASPQTATHPPLAGGVLGASASRLDPPSEKGAAARKDSSNGQSGPSEILDQGGLPLKILLALGAVVLLILGGLAVKEEWVG
jgi:hypothetical protein